MGNKELDEFIWRKSKKIICFGAGSYFHIMYHDFTYRNKDFKVWGVIDNDSGKNGKCIAVGEEYIPVLSIGAIMEQYKPEEIVLLITTAFYQDVLKQIQNIDYFNRVEIYSYHDLKKNSTDTYEVLHTSLSEAVIPKRIHYCWFGGKEMPAHLRREVDNWHKLCPDYEFICWNEKNYDVDKIPYTREAYANRRWAHLPDYVRLDVVYQHGGIYMDTDVELLQSLDILRQNEAFFGTEVSGGINEGSGFGAVKGHTFVKELMSVYEQLDSSNLLYYTTSLGKEIETFHKHGYVNNGKYQVIDGITIYPYQVLAPMIKETNECMKTNATVAVHHFEGSWC